MHQHAEAKRDGSPEAVQGQRSAPQRFPITSTPLSRQLNDSPSSMVMQAMAAPLAKAPAVQRTESAGKALAARAPNRTGLPDGLKAGVEALSGISMDDVRVHRNSPRPAALQAHAFAQGSDIHLASEQERHLPHEAWHVVQQKQGRVAATRQLVAGTAINDDVSLEREADVMGARAAAGITLMQPKALDTMSSGPVGAPAQRAIRGLSDYVKPESIPKPWVEAFIADTDHEETHLYLPEMERYLDQHVAGWRDRATLNWAGNHWEVESIETGNRVRTRADGNCGVHAIHAIAQGAEGSELPEFAAGPEIVAAVRGAIRGLLTDAGEIAARIAVEIAQAETVAETGFGPRLAGMLREFEVAAARVEEQVDLQGSGASGEREGEAEEQKEPDADSKGAKQDDPEAAARYNAIFKALSLTFDIIHQIADLAPIRSWMMGERGEGPEDWQDAMKAISAHSSAEELEGAFRMILPLDPAGATPELLERVQALVGVLRGAGRGTGGGKHENDYTDELMGPMQELTTALGALADGGNSERTGGLARMRGLFATYERSFGTTAEWPIGAEYTDRKLANRAIGFYRLMVDLADTLLGMSPSQRSRFKAFIAAMQGWQSSTCHNGVVSKLLNLLPGK